MKEFNRLETWLFLGLFLSSMIGSIGAAMYEKHQIEKGVIK